MLPSWELALRAWHPWLRPFRFCAGCGREFGRAVGTSGRPFENTSRLWHQSADRCRPVCSRGGKSAQMRLRVAHHRVWTHREIARVLRRGCTLGATRWQSSAAARLCGPNCRGRL